jgi:hypothetical protein
MKQQRGGLMVCGFIVCLAVGAGFENMRQARMASGKAVAPVFVTRSTADETDDAVERLVMDAFRRRVGELELALIMRAGGHVQVPKPLGSTESKSLADVLPGNLCNLLPDERWHGLPLSECMVRETGLTEFQKTDLGLFDELRSRRERFVQMAERRIKAQTNFLAAVDTQDMRAEQREVHEQLLDAVAQVNELQTRMGASDTEISSEDRRATREALTVLGDLYRAERRYLFEEAACGIGYDGEQAALVADYFLAIIEYMRVPPALNRRLTRPQVQPK